MTTVALRSLVFSLSLTCLAFTGPERTGPELIAPELSGRSARQAAANSALSVHEWGTFTSIADRSGQAVEWLPLNGSTDLPSFVEHFRTAEFKVGLRGTIRMETPVLYFYSPSETTVSVKVGFSSGVITEWYPSASHVEPNPKNVLDSSALFQREGNGSIAWDSVTVSPGVSPNLPRGRNDNGSHYYTARETSAAPVVVRTRKGTQQEKFLFYRGVSVFSIPLAAQSMPDGKVLIKNLGQDEIPSIILFERRGDKVGYRLEGGLQSESMLEPPELNSTVDALSHDLEGVLMEQGLYPDEARAMVETWRLSWFEEGSRVLYIVPASFVNRVLPLRIDPAPSQTVRAFVGRLELITPATEQAIEDALAGHDQVTIQKYGRFLSPILEQVKAENPGRAQELDKEWMELYTNPDAATVK